MTHTLFLVVRFTDVPAPDNGIATGSVEQLLSVIYGQGIDTSSVQRLLHITDSIRDG